MQVESCMSHVAWESYGESDGESYSEIDGEHDGQNDDRTTIGNCEGVVADRPVL